jgi:hypothetical protein
LTACGRLLSNAQSPAEQDNVDEHRLHLPIATVHDVVVKHFAHQRIFEDEAIARRQETGEQVRSLVGEGTQQSGERAHGVSQRRSRQGDEWAGPRGERDDAALRRVGSHRRCHAAEYRDGNHPVLHLVSAGERVGAAARKSDDGEALDCQGVGELLDVSDAGCEIILQVWRRGTDSRAFDGDDADLAGRSEVTCPRRNLSARAGCAVEPQNSPSLDRTIFGISDAASVAQMDAALESGAAKLWCQGYLHTTRAPERHIVSDCIFQHRSLFDNERQEPDLAAWSELH